MRNAVTFDANAEGDNVIKYWLYWGSASQTYNGSSSPIDLGTSTSYTFVTNQADEALIYFALAAENSEGLSAFSAEATKRATKTAMFR